MTAERDTAELEAAIDKLRVEAAIEGIEPKHPYRLVESGIWWLKRDKDGETTPVRLTNFQARIVRDVTEDDGLERRHVFEVEGRLQDGPPARQAVAAGQFAAMGWVLELLGASAILEPGTSVKDRARAAIQYLSGSVERAHVYTHTGWRRLAGGEHVYLHAGGAIGAEGTVAGVEVALPPALARYRLPEPPSGDEERAVVLASLLIADAVAIPDRLSVPVLAAAYRAPLGPVDMSLALIGESGLGKSELAALAQQHFGPELERMRLPANFHSTANFLLGLAFNAADALLVVDDFKPTGNRIDRQRAHAEASRLLTAQGNQSGRGRADATGAPRAIRDPRGLLLMTGEEVPEGYSARARALILEVNRGDVDGLGLRPGQAGYTEQHPRLNQLQAAAREGVYARALAGYLRWLAPQLEELRGRLRERVAELRNRVRAGHARTGGNVAELMAGVECWLEYARSIEAMTEAEATAWRERAWAALLEAAGRQEGHQERVRPERRFLELLMSAIGSGAAHVADRAGGPPGPPEAWGWRLRVVGTGDYAENRWEPQGARVGWLDDDDLYLDKAAAYRAAAEMDSENGIGVGPDTLPKRLHQAGVLASVSSEKDGRLVVRRTVEGRFARVLHLHATTLNPSTVSSPQQTGITGIAGMSDGRASSGGTTVIPVPYPGPAAPEPRTGMANRDSPQFAEGAGIPAIPVIPADQRGEGGQTRAGAVSNTNGCRSPDPEELPGKGEWKDWQ